MIQILKLFLFFLALSSLATVASSQENPDIWKNYEKTLKLLPKDASKTLDIAVTCHHLSGEFNGDKSQRDREITQTMNKLHCNKIDKKVSVIKNKYKNNRGVQEAFKIYDGNQY